MTIAQVPGPARAVIPDSAILLGVGDEPRILHRIQESFAVVFGIGAVLVQEISQNNGHFRFTGRISAGQSRMAVSCGIRLPWREAAIPLPRHLCAGRIDLVQIFQDCAYRGVETVKVESMEGRSLGGDEWGIMGTQSIHECPDLLVAPHPSGETRKGRPFRWRIFEMSDVMVDPRSVRPIALDGHEAEAFLYDQLA